MTVDIADLRVYVGALDDEYADLLDGCLLEATDLVEHYVGTKEVPTSVLDRAVKEVAAGLFDRRNAPSGYLPQQFATTDGQGVTPARVARDPLTPAYGLLRRFVGAW